MSSTCSLLRVVPFLTLAVLFGFGCRSTPPAASTPAAVSADTWATVDGRAIVRDEVEKAFRRARDVAQPMAPEEELAAKLALLDELIVEDLLMAKAAALKVEVPATELDTAYNNAKSNIPDQAFQEELTRRNITTADMREGLRRQLLAQKVLEREVSSKVSITDQQITDFFNGNRAQFNLPEEAFHVAQIVITPVREPQLANRTGDDATTADAATKKAAMLMARLKEGANFADLARDYSEDIESAPRGGDMGFMPRSALAQASPQLRDAVITAAPGTVRAVAQNGAHTLVLVVAKEPAGQRELTSPGVRARIGETLRARKEQLLRAAYLAALRSDADVVNYLARRVVETQGAPQ
jgi:parvulin-like peptidyl-prolyl isomerase